MKRCQNCGEQYSAALKSCPKCGRRQKTSIVIPILLTFLVLGIWGGSLLIRERAKTPDISLIRQEFEISEDKFTLYNLMLCQYLSISNDQLIGVEQPNKYSYWSYEKNKSGFRFIRNGGTPKYVLDIDNAIMTKGHLVKVWGETGYDVQSWFFQQVEIGSSQNALLICSDNKDNGEFCLGYDTINNCFCIIPVEQADLSCCWVIS